MRFNELQIALRTQPFEPSRVHLSSGQSYEVRHPEFASLTRHSLYVGVPQLDDEVPDRAIKCDLLHVVAIEPIDGTARSE